MLRRRVADGCRDIGLPGAESLSYRAPRTSRRPSLQLFLTILLSVMAPILILVALGFFVQRRLNLDLATLSNLQIHVLIPAAILYFLLSARLPLSEAWSTFWFTAVLFAAHFAIGWVGAALAGAGRAGRELMGLAVAFPNSGNYG